jgi:hypothetical protein
MVAHRPEVWVIGCDGAKVSFDVGEVLVGAYHVNGAQSVCFQAGADHVDAVESCFGGYLALIPVIREGVVGDGGDEMLADLVFVDDLSCCDADLVGSAQATCGD